MYDDMAVDAMPSQEAEFRCLLARSCRARGMGSMGRVALRVGVAASPCEGQHVCWM